MVLEIIGAFEIFWPLVSMRTKHGIRVIRNPFLQQTIYFSLIEVNRWVAWDYQGGGPLQCIFAMNEQKGSRTASARYGTLSQNGYGE